MPRRDVAYLKPTKFKHYLTLAEMAEKVGRDPSWLRHLEREERIPRAKRVKRGKIQIRLWSPDEANEIVRIISTHHPGRPRNA